MDNINEIIDNICAKIGTAAERMIPEYARMKVASNTVLLMFSVVVLAVSIVAVRYAYRWYKKDEYDDTRSYVLIGTSVFTVSAVLLFLILGIYALMTIIKYSTAPHAAFIEEMLNGARK